MPSQIVTDCSKSLAEKKLTVAFAESATAGRLASEFALCEDSGKILKGGLVCYDAELKKSILHVPQEILDQFTPESAEVTKEIAERLQPLIPAEIHVGVTGLTTPGGSETPEKPVGTIFLHAFIQDRSIAVREVFKGEPEEIVLQAIDRVAELIMQEIAYDQQVPEQKVEK
ncbi:CinA family protein [Dyadobacter sediminis]|uniref:CinA family protein n=1 Tax=Dyadobacter sediminis TaxID=1493691 RepID=A0A5R9KI64_9BACT|nr:CinA family protein [Dyadobacter sediminis]TLU95908.1 CinA family protein [Dyadobacter sediminis]GGB77641.1 damage-inducible protein CinA [Dyadobacter sediminis]